MAAVAESPVFAAGSIVAQENSSEVGSLLEDQDIYLELPAAATILQDLDGSETLSQVRIGGLNDIGGLGLVGSLVDETGASIGTSDGAGTTTLTAAQYAGEVYFRPPTDYNGTVDLTVVAVSQEPSSGSTATSDTYALNFSLDPVSEEPDVSASNLSLNEDTDASGSYSGVDLTNISVSLSDTSSLSNVTVTLSAVDSVGSALSGFTLEGTSTVSTGSYDSGTLTLTVSGTPVGVDLLADLDTLLGDVTLRPPEDFSGDATITVGVTATEQGAEPSQQTTADFTASVAAVAESPTLSTQTLTGSEDSHTSLEISNSIINAVSNDLDGSEAISQYVISGLTTDAGETFLIVDSSQNPVGTSDGSGGTTITKAQFDAGIYLLPPDHFSGSVTLNVTAISKESGSLSTAETTGNFLVQISPVAEVTTVSVPASSTFSPIQILEYTGSDDYTSTSLNSSVVAVDDSDETQTIYITLQNNGSELPKLYLSGSEVSALSSSEISALNSQVSGQISSNTSVFQLSSIDDLENISFIPPNSSTGNYRVKVISESSDTNSDLSETDTSVTTQSIFFDIIAVAKSPDVTFEGSSVSDGDSLSLSSLTKTGTLEDNTIAIDLTVAAGDVAGTDIVTVLVTGVSDDFVFYENDGGNYSIVGARNETGTVYIFELSDGFDGSTSFAVRVDPDTVLNWNEANSADQSFNFTAFAIDSSNAGTTASNEFALTTTITKSSDNDPIIIDLDGGGLNDNFNVSAKNYDIDGDNLLDEAGNPVEKVFLPDENVGILIYAPDGLENLVTNTYLTVTENVFSDSFQLLDDNGGVVATASSSFDALLLLDDDGSDSEDKSDNIINSDDVEYNNIGYWLDVDQDGMYTAGLEEIVSLASRVGIIDLTNPSISNTVIDGGADGNYEGIIHRSATITLDSQAYDAYEVSLAQSVDAGNAFPAPTIGFSASSLSLDEGLPGESNSLGLNITAADGSPDSIVTLVTISGIPDEVLLSQGVRQANGDWLVLATAPDSGSEALDISFIAADSDFSGSFVMTAWATTTDTLAGTTVSTASQTAVVELQPVVDDAIFTLPVTSVTGFEDAGLVSGTPDLNNALDAPIPLVVRYALGDLDGSEEASIELTVSTTDESDVSSLELAYFDKTSNNFQLLDSTHYTRNTSDPTEHVFTFSNIQDVNDPIISRLHLVPMADFVGQIDIDVQLTVTEQSATSKTYSDSINVTVLDRADAVEIKLGGDLASALSANEIDSSTASTGGTLLLSTDGDGVYTGLTQTDDSALSNDQFDALIIGVDVADIILEVRGVDDNGDETVSQFTSKPDGDGYAFNVPSLGASESLHLVTPSFFDGSINLTLKTLSQGSAGDTAMSEEVEQTLEVYSEGDGVDLKVGDANGIEDSIVPVRLPISATRIDTSEEIVSVRLTMATEDFGSSEAAISYVTRIETRMTGIEDIKSLVAEGASFIDAATLGAETPKSVSFADLSDVSLIVRSAPGYGQNVPSLKSVTDLAGIETAMSDADIDVYAMFLRGTYTTADGNEITTSFAVEDASGVLTDNSMTVDVMVILFHL